MPPPKKGKKGNGKRKETTTKETFDHDSTIIKLQDELVEISRQEISFREKVKRLREENDSLRENIKQTKIDRERYLKVSQERSDAKIASMEELKLMVDDKVNTMRENSQTYLAELNDSNTETLNKISDRQTELFLAKKKMRDMDSYKNTERMQLELIDGLADKLDDMRLKHELEGQNFKVHSEYERKSLLHLVKREMRIMDKEIAKVTGSCMKSKLEKIRSVNEVMKMKLLAILKMRISVEGRREKLQKVMDMLDQEDQYWMDLNCIHYGFPMENVDNSSSAMWVDGRPSNEKPSKGRTRKRGGCKAKLVSVTSFVESDAAPESSHSD